MVPDVTKDIIEAAIEQANNEVEMAGTYYSVSKRRSEKYYDIESGKHYYKIISEYETPQDTYGTVLTMYELQ